MVLKMTQSFHTRSMHAVGVSVGPATRSVSETKLGSSTALPKQLSPNQQQPQPHRDERGESTVSSSSSSYGVSAALDDVALEGEGNLQEESLDDEPPQQQQQQPAPEEPGSTSTSGSLPVIEGLSHGLIEISLAAQEEDDAAQEPSQCDLDAIDDLIECAKEGDLPLFQQLCESLSQRHLSPDCAGYMGWTPAHWAARNGHVHLLEYLLHHQHVNLDLLDKKGDSLLHKAAANGQFRICQWLLQHGFNVQVRNNNGQTPLVIAQQLAAMSKSQEAALCASILEKENAHTF